MDYSDRDRRGLSLRGPAGPLDPAELAGRGRVRRRGLVLLLLATLHLLIPLLPGGSFALFLLL